MWKDLSFMQGGFLKSSPKIALIPKSTKQSFIHNQSRYSLNSESSISTRTDPRAYSLTSHRKSTTHATWICPICTYSNPVPSDFNPATANERTPVAPCSTCGVKPPWATVLKAAISNAAQVTSSALSQDLKARPNTSLEPSDFESSTQSIIPKRDKSNSFECPRCTFLNHSSILTCELCGAPLISQGYSLGIDNPTGRAESIGPMINPMAHPAKLCVKLSFRGGGEKIFLERLKSSMVQRKWLSHGAPPVPSPNYSIADGGFGANSEQRPKAGGIAGLEARRLQERQKNERVLGSAFEDLEALMASAQEILALAESFASNNGNVNSGSDAVANALGLVTTKEMFSSKSESLYITELTRNLVDFLTDDSRSILKKSGGIINLVDLWAKFNRARGGVELVSPNDFAKAARQCETLKLPFRLREFKSGVLVVQGSEHTDQKIIASIKNWLNNLHHVAPEQKVTWEWQKFGCGVTAQETAERFGWSIGVAEEELEIAEEEGTLCREVGIEGTRFWINHLILPDMP